MTVYLCRLETASGHDVLDEGMVMPPFIKMPEVVMWGSRVFQWRSQHDHDDYKGEYGLGESVHVIVHTYTEVMMYVLTDMNARYGKFTRT